MPSSLSDRAWSDQELRACVQAYYRLWQAEQRGEQLNKSALRRDTLSLDLLGRVKGSYEFRMQNISSLLSELGLPFVRGYLPRKNIGKAKNRLIAIINEVWRRTESPEKATDNPDELESRVSAALEKFTNPVTAPPSGTLKVQSTLRSSQVFVRDPNVIAWVLARSEGKCEACHLPAPFVRTDDTPYLEVHHIRPLMEGGPDVVANAIAACPNCHRRLHHSIDRKVFRKSILKHTPGLIDYPKRSLE